MNVKEELEKAVEEGRVAFARPGATPPVVDHRLVEKHVLGGRAIHGVQIKGAVIKGKLNLRDAWGPSGEPCSALILENCVLEGDPNCAPSQPGIDASHSHLQRLALINCETNGVELSGAIIVGDLDLDGLGPIRLSETETRRETTDRGACWVKARGVRIGGSVTAREAKLSLPAWAPPTDGPPAVRPPANADYWRNVTRAYALDLAGSDIGGSLRLEPAFVALGGVSISEASIGGAIRAEGAVMAGVEGSSNETPTIALGGASVRGSVHIDAWRAPIELMDATTVRVGGDLKLSGLLFDADFSGSVIDGQVALGRTNAPLLMTPAAVLSLADTRVGRDLKVWSIHSTTFPVELDWDMQTALRVRSMKLESYPGWSLAEALYEPKRSNEPKRAGLAILAFLFRPGGTSENDRAVVLSGESAPIHRLNDEEGVLRLQTEVQAREYVAFFCSHIWGPEGAFRVVPGSVKVKAVPAPLDASAVIAYGSGLFRAELSIQASGEVVMDNDEPHGKVFRDLRQHYASPIRWFDVPPGDEASAPEWPTRPPLGTDVDWGEVEPEDLATMMSALGRYEGKDSSSEHQTRPRRVVVGYPTEPDEDDEAKRQPRPRPRIDLGGLKAASLDDDNGVTWFGRESIEAGITPSNLQLVLTGFEYDSINARRRERQGAPFDFKVGKKEPALEMEVNEAPGGSITEESRDTTVEATLEPTEARRYWLQSQYESEPPTDKEYRPQPYQQLARVWRAEGLFKEADEITLHRLELEKTRLKLSNPELQPRRRVIKHRLLQWAAWPIKFFFGFGLKPLNATWTFAGFWLVGVLVIWGLSGTGVLKVDASAVATVVSRDGGAERVVVEEANVKKGPEEITCGNQINEVIYPLDVMIPLVDLRQESRCHFSFDSWGLAFAKGVYAILGWLILTGFIITWSGVVRRHTEG